MSASAECDLMMTGLLESIACFACTISLKSASSWFDIRLSMEVTFDIGNRWQYPSKNRYRVVLSVFNVFLLLSISQLKKILISGDLFSFSCWKALVPWILTLADFTIVNLSSFSCTCGVFPRDFPVTATLPQSLGMMDSTRLMSSFSAVKKMPNYSSDCSH